MIVAVLRSSQMRHVLQRTAIQQFGRFHAAAVLTILVLVFPYGGKLSAQQAQAQEIKTRRAMTGIGIPAELKSSVALADHRLSEWYPILGPKLGVHLTNPNIVLLLENERGLADLNFYNWSESDVKAISRFNEVAFKDGIRISYSKSAKIGDAEVDGWFENLTGYDRVSHNTKLPGIIPYEASTGWKGLASWKEKVVEAVVDCSKSGTYTTEIDKSIVPRADDYFPTAEGAAVTTAVLRGLAYGYPDSAVYLPGAKGKAVFTVIPYAEFHRASAPNFSYASDANLDDINKKVARWAMLLGEFYHSQDYLKLAKDDKFKKARIIADGCGEK
ncbi:MAG: hypothetical protein JSS83_06125 [Cyanobacteria bacterium SZAS LIN-3]|nr:hypothetical protein [Cyanobacteria bacterium SZAS LIN-3]